MHCRMFCSIPGLSPLVTIAPLPPVRGDQKRLQNCHMYSGGCSRLPQNNSHSCLKAALLCQLLWFKGLSPGGPNLNDPGVFGFTDLYFFLVLYYLVHNFCKLWKFTQFHKIQPGHIQDPAKRLRRAGFQIQSCSPWGKALAGIRSACAPCFRNLCSN